jgi:YARHG domain
MNIRLCSVMLLILAMPPYSYLAQAETVDVQQVLDQITNTADKICSVVSNRGEASSEEVKGNVKAQLTGLASKLADIGVSGSGAINNEAYQNVLQQDLAATLRDNAACKLKVFDTLQGKLLKSDAAPPAPITPTAPAVPNAPVLDDRVAPKPVESMSCDELWHARNELYTRNGYCFQTPRAQAAFGKGCFPPYGALQGADKDRVSEIQLWERRKGC